MTAGDSPAVAGGGRVRLALVGCGAISPLHRFGIEQSEAPIDIVAVVDPDRHRLREAAEATGASGFTTLEAAVESTGPDAVDLMLPHHLHEPIAVQCFEAGLHVLLEKPMAPTLDECDRIMAAARTAGTVFMVAENAQYWPEVLTVAAELQAGAIGAVVTARASTFFPPLPDFYGTAGDDGQGRIGTDGDRPWRFDQAIAGGGVAIDTGSHWLRPLCIWLGELDSVVAALGHPFPDMAGESLVRSLLRFRSGVVAGFDALLTDAPLAPEVLFRLTGTEGELTIDMAGRVMRYRKGERRGAQVGATGGYLDSYAGQFTDFAAAVLHGTPPAAGPEAALGELRAALAMYRSAGSGRWEEVWA